MTGKLDIKNSELYILLNESVPQIKKIEKTLRGTNPEIIAELIATESLTAFIFDYYFRKFDFNIAGQIINHPAISADILVELFSCQIIRYYLANLYSDNHNSSYASLIDSYWSRLNREKLQLLFKSLLGGGESSQLSAIMMLQNMSLDDLSILDRTQSKGLLKFLKKHKDNFDRVISNNLDLYDFLHKTARDMNDLEYLNFLDEFTELAINLRIAQNFAEEAEEHKDEDNKIPLQVLGKLIQEIPGDAVGFTLGILRDKGYVSQESIDDLFNFLKESSGSL